MSVNDADVPRFSSLYQRRNQFSEELKGKSLAELSDIVRDCPHRTSIPRFADIVLQRDVPDEFIRAYVAYLRLHDSKKVYAERLVSPWKIRNYLASLTKL